MFAKPATLCVLALSLSVSTASAQRAFDTDILAETFGYGAETPKTIDLEDLKQGCPSRDCIRSLDDPAYVSAAAADFLDETDYVIGIGIGDDYRAYPTAILDRHEIVNDTIGGEPVAVTWCPLCGSAVGIRRSVNGNVTEFGVSGLLYNSDLVLYDRTTETLWDQIEASGIVGPLTGTELELVPVTMTRWSRWREAHPGTLVLSNDTGFGIDYSQDPYASYRASSSLMFPVGNEDGRVHPKTVVYGFDTGAGKLAVPEDLLDDGEPVEASLGGRTATVSMREDGSVRLVDADGDVHAPVRLFWFAWFTFHPETALLN